jgi:hypothetical protein
MSLKGSLKMTGSLTSTGVVLLGFINNNSLQLFTMNGTNLTNQPDWTIPRHFQFSAITYVAL